MTQSAAGRLRSKENRPFGLEVDFDLRQPLTEIERGALHDQLYAHGLLLFRGQALTMEEQIGVAECFGPVLASADDGVGYLSNVEGKGTQGRIRLPYHSDLAFTSDPYLAISFLALDVQGGRSSTRLAHGAYTYRMRSFPPTRPCAIWSPKCRYPDLRPYDCALGRSMISEARRLPTP